MKLIDDIFSKITNPDAILVQMESLLSQLDPDFEAIHKPYLSAVDALTEIAPEQTRSYLHEANTAYTQELLFLFFKGIQMNVACFNNPVNAKILEMDFEVIHHEYQMNALPGIVQARTLAMAAAHQLPEERLLPVLDYFAYRETVGWKLAHFWGYLLGNRLLYHLIPGYTQDEVTTLYYKRMLSDYLQFGLN